ncbi:uncharacterized protein LOC144455911 [Phascolarctos cinereus]
MPCAAPRQEGRLTGCSASQKRSFCRKEEASLPRKKTSFQYTIKVQRVHPEIAPNKDTSKQQRAKTGHRNIHTEVEMTLRFPVCGPGKQTILGALLLIALENGKSLTCAAASRS